MQVVVIVSSGCGSGHNGRCHVMVVGEAAAMVLASSITVEGLEA